MSFDWNDPAIQSAGKIDWYEGMEIVGTISSIGLHTFPARDDQPEKVVPQVFFDDGLVVTCGASDLKKKMIAAKPQAGDRIKIEVIGSTKTAVGTQFFFRVSVAPKPSLPPSGAKPPADPAHLTAAVDYPAEPPF